MKRGPRTAGDIGDVRYEWLQQKITGTRPYDMLRFRAQDIGPNVCKMHPEEALVGMFAFATGTTRVVVGFCDRCLPIAELLVKSAWRVGVER